MENLYKDAKEFLGLHKLALFVNACVCVICYGHLVFSQNVGIDTEHVINYPGVTMQWMESGDRAFVYEAPVWGYGIQSLSGRRFVLAGFILLGSVIMFCAGASAAGMTSIRTAGLPFCFPHARSG